MAKRVIIAATLLSLCTASAFAQSSTSDSGAMAVINQNSSSTSQAPGVGAPGLAAAGIETCTSSASSGFSGPGFGISIGGTGVDAGCDARLDARTLMGVGLPKSAILRLCEREKIAIAMAQSGEFVCPQIKVPTGQVMTQQAVESTVQTRAAMKVYLNTLPVFRYDEATGTITEVR